MHFWHEIRAASMVFLENLLVGGQIEVACVAVQPWL